MRACPVLETERLVLRPFREADLDAYTAVLQEPSVRRSLRLPDDVGRAEAWAQMAAFLGQWELRGTGQWALEEKATGTFVGRAGLHHPERTDWPGIEVGWALDPAHQGKGYATEAGARAVRYAFDELRSPTLWSCIRPDNVRSAAVARRLGFRLVETRVMAWHPTEPHGLWRLDADLHTTDDRPTET